MAFKDVLDLVEVAFHPNCKKKYTANVFCSLLQYDDIHDWHENGFQMNPWGIYSCRLFILKEMLFNT